MLWGVARMRVFKDTRPLSRGSAPPALLGMGPSCAPTRPCTCPPMPARQAAAAASAKEGAPSTGGAPAAAPLMLAPRPRAKLAWLQELLDRGQVPPTLRVRFKMPRSRVGGAGGRQEGSQDGGAISSEGGSEGGSDGGSEGGSDGGESAADDDTGAAAGGAGGGGGPAAPGAWAGPEGRLHLARYLQGAQVPCVELAAAEGQEAGAMLTLEG